MLIKEHFPSRDVVEFPKLHAKGRRIFVDFNREKLRIFEEGRFGERVITSPPHFQVYHDVMLQPLKWAGPHEFTGGAFRGGEFVAELALRRGRGSWEHQHINPGSDLSKGDGQADSPIDRLRSAWFGGILFPHYGHFILETLARVQSLEVADSTEPLVFYNPWRLPHLRPFMEGVFNHLGISTRRIILCNSIMEVGTLRAQSPNLQLNSHINISAKVVLKRGAPSYACQERSIYLSRSKTKVPRSVRDEEAFERRINAAKLAEVIHPERLDFERQIEQLQSAALVSGCEGSAFHSLIFVEGVRTSLIFCAQLPPMSYFLCDELIDGDVVYLRCNASPPEQGDPRKTPWVLNTNKAYRLLEFLGRVLN